MMTNTILAVSLATVASVIIGSILICWYYQRRARWAEDVAAIATAAAEQITEEQFDSHATSAERVVHGMTGPELGVLQRIESELSEDHSLVRAARRHKRKARK